MPAPARAQEPLAVCLDENVPPFSVRHGASGSGFDLAVADAVAKRLGRALRIQWYESKVELDSSSALSANALLSDGRCQLVAGYPLVKDELGAPGAPTARLPDYAGAKGEDHRRRVTLGTLVPSAPYFYAPLTVILGPGAPKRAITSLADLDGLHLAVEEGTLADEVLMRFGDGRLVNRITHLVPGREDPLPRLEKSDFDAAFLPLRRFDAYRAEHPQTALRPSGYYYRIGFNMGFVGLASAPDLLAQVNRALTDMAAHDAFRPLAEAAGMTYVPPREPAILDSISLADLGRE